MDAMDITSSTMTIQSRTEYPVVAYNVSKEIIAMASIKAGVKEDAKKTPVDIVAVIDKSGSMAGSKIDMVRRTLEFVVSQLDENDQFALVEYDTNVSVTFNFCAMTKEKKMSAKTVIGRLQSGSSTNLSGGLLKGLDIITQERPKSNTVCSVLLLTDGLANVGIVAGDQIAAAVKAKLSGSPVNSTASVFTFGFGEDHDANLLRQISECAHGMFYYVKNVDDIPLAFADCLGGLQSVVAQNCVLHVRCLDDKIKIVKSLNKQYQVNTALPASEVEVSFPDLYSEEARDILFAISLPKLEEPIENPEPLLDFHLKYFDVSLLHDASCRSQLEITRPRSVPDTLVRDLDVDMQLNRIHVADALDESRALSERGEFEKVHKLLGEVRASVTTSASSNTPYSANLAVELDDTMQSATRTSYAQEGSKKLNMRAMAHHQQRAAASEQGFYETNAKASKKNMWFSSK